MTWKGTFCTEYAWSLCGSSLLFSCACGRPNATNTPRSSPTSCIPFVPLVASPAHTLCSEIPPSLALHRRLLATLPSFSSPCFSPRSSCLHRVLFHFWPFSFCPPSLLWCSLCKAWRVFWGLKALPVCLLRIFSGGIERVSLWSEEVC